MNKKEYLDSLLDLCTERQKDLFCRMYPEGPKTDQIKMAISQVENTLKNLNATNEDLNTVKKESDAFVDKLTIKINEVEAHLENTESELKEAYAKIERLENPINIENNKIQERLALLDALEAGGVDNWTFYGDAIESYQESL